MAPLSKELAGVILPHDTFGSHLDASGRTTNDKLELRNFANAVAVLAEIWSNLTFDGYPVVAEYVAPKQGHLKQEQLMKRDAAWISRHVATSQYFLQIVKCNNVACCGRLRSDIRHLAASSFQHHYP